MLGDIQAQQPLEVELAPILGKTVVRFIHGNHDTDIDFEFRNLFESKLADANLDGRVEEIDGVRVTGLGGIFRGKVWRPPEELLFDSYGVWLQANKLRYGESDVVLQIQARTHHSTIFWDVYSCLWDQTARTAQRTHHIFTDLRIAVLPYQNDTKNTSRSGYANVRSGKKPRQFFTQEFN